MEADLQPLNLGLNSAWKYTQDREHWKHLVETAKLQLGLARDDDDDDWLTVRCKVDRAVPGHAYPQN